MFAKLLEYCSRKFVLSLTSLVGTFLLVWHDKDVMGWATAIGVILGFYNGANIAEYMVKRKQEVSDKVGI